MARILVVDDSGMARRMLRKMLEEAGHEVLEATDGLPALECYSLDRPDVVLLDLTMEEMYGLDVLDMLLQIDAEARVIITSADVQRKTREMAAMNCAAPWRRWATPSICSTCSWRTQMRR